MPSRFTDHEVKSGLKAKRALSQFIDSVFAANGIAKNSLQYIFCSDAYLLEINQQFLNHDTYTDIVTFDQSEDRNKKVEGEIYVSVDRIRENAAKFKTSYERELHRVIFHGCLHLCGYKDKKKAEAELMRQKEDECLQGYFGQE